MPAFRLSRRDFLRTGVAAGAVARFRLKAEATRVRQGEAEARKSVTDGDGWFDRPMRWVQLTLVENDPGRFDPQFWLDYFRRVQADAACLSAGGIVAYYPTEVALHHRST